MTGWTVPEGYRSYPDALNITTEVVDRQVARGLGTRLALRDGAETWTYAELHAIVDRHALTLAQMGVVAGTRIATTSFVGGTNTLAAS